MKHNQGLILSATVLATLAMGATTLTANAATTYKRSKVTKVSSKAYYSQRQTGKTYQFKGTAKKLTFKANHALKNYTKTTWQTSKKTTVTKHGKQYLYYYVKNSRNGATGWVYSKYLKAGKNFQATTPTTTTATTYTPAKMGKVYTLSGDNTYVKFSNGQALKTDENYTQTQQRYVYKAGKKYLYYFVTSADKKVNGWTWHGYLKEDSSSDSSTVTNANNTTITDTNHTDSSTASSTGDVTPAWATYDGKRSQLVINSNDFGSFLAGGHTYGPGVYYNGKAYTDIHNVYDTSNPYQYGQQLSGLNDGKLTAMKHGSVNIYVPIDGDVLFIEDGAYTGVLVPSFNPESGSELSGADYFQYMPDTNNYVIWRFNLKTKQWDKSITVNDPFGY
ncbi:hypothetical protein [Lactiplantibacillus songbeiensis]|uniref:Extracellular protein n=1 Tax=Lactiplantibacillus songbeiensis TaxID=2559920 RepID=A0ABW4C319_9LACO|nr:hypothetical protein [Lactiplantibacillus songbeiensis]